MNGRILIDGIMQQTVVLIAQLATAGGLRAPLAHVAGQVFVGLARELERQGVGKKVSADMFGMALRTYQRRTQRLLQSQTDQGRSLWSTVLEFVNQESPVGRERILQRFRFDDAGAVRGVLRDLTESGLVYVTGSGRSLTYRRAEPGDSADVKAQADELSTEALVWSIVFREQPITMTQLAEACRVEAPVLDQLVDSLVAGSQVVRDDSTDPPTLHAAELFIGLENAAGWEAAVLDHFAAMVSTIATKLRQDQQAHAADTVGGSTYHFSLWRGHPYEQEVLGELRRFRERMTALRQKIDQYAEQHEAEGARYSAHVYYGQTTTEEDSDDVDEEA